MNKDTAITCLFLDIGGCLTHQRMGPSCHKRAAANFKLEFAGMEERHNLNFSTYEGGKLTLEEYLCRVVFYQNRPFTLARFRHFMFEQSKPYPGLIDLVRTLKEKFKLKIIVVSNEARDMRRNIVAILLRHKKKSRTYGPL